MRRGSVLPPVSGEGRSHRTSVAFDDNIPLRLRTSKSGQQKFAEHKQRRMSKAPLMRRELMALSNRRNTEVMPETPEPEEVLDDEVLFSRLQKMFEAAEEDGGLPIDEFKEAMRKTVGRHSTEEEIELLFMKVDANCDGKVDWEEYVTYNLLEYKERTLMIEMLREKPFPNEVRDIDSRHRDVIVKIIFYPNIRKACAGTTKICQKSGKYVTLSKEGVVGLWTLNMKNLKYYNANHYQNRNTHPWFTDMVPMYNVNMLALTSTDRDISIFDITTKKFTMRYYVTGFDNCLTAMDYWVDSKDLNISLLLLGDTSGCIYSIRFETALRGGPFGAVNSKKNSCKRISFPEIMRGFVLGVKAQKIPNVHEDWVNKVMYLPAIDCFLSSCQGQQSALFFGDFTGKKSHVYFKVNKGVLSFDYSHHLNIIVTAGMDYFLRVWNPYVNNKAIVILKGHTKPVNHVIINESKNQVISIDKGRSLRVFDLRDQTCLQHISGRMIKFDPFPISACFYNAAMRTILLAANQIVMLEKREEDEGFFEAPSHNKPVVAAIYSKVFNSVVSACQESVVSIWDTKIGDKMMQFVNAHCRIERGVEIPVEITTLCFDYNGRRLLTGARNGTIHVWNFNNGSLMQNFELPDNSDVTGIVCTQHSFYVTGWGRTVYSYVDGGGEEHRKNWKVQHKEDILSIAYLPPNLIVTGSYDGDVVIWSRETGQVYCRLNAFENELSHRSHSKSIKSRVNQNSQQSDTATDDDETSAGWQKGRSKVRRVFGMGLFGRMKGVSLEESTSPSQTDNVETCKHPLLQALDPTSFSSNNETVFSRDQYDNVCKSYESAVEKIVFLETREPLQKDTAIIVTSGAEGWIRFWSMHHEGGLLGQFNAAHSLGESVLAMKIDTNNHFLFTGDTQGYVKIWDIREYCIGKKFTANERKTHLMNMRQKFTFFRVESYKQKTHLYSVPEYLKSVFSSRPPPASSEPHRTLRYPIMLNSFRAHTHSIHSIDYVTDRELLITASADCSVRLWTVNGQYIGTFGGEKWAPLPKIVTTDYFLCQIPTDIKRAGSARTLKVLHGGKTPMWKSAIGILKTRGVERLKKQFLHLQELVQEVQEHASPSDLETSNILGKSYKKTMKHRMPPTLPKFIETPGSVAVYHTLPFAELTPVGSLNDTMKAIQARRAGNVALGKMRGQKSKKAEVPAILQIFNKLVNKPGPTVKRFPPANRMKKVADKYQGPLPHQSPDARGKRARDTRTEIKQSEPNILVEKPPDEPRDESLGHSGIDIMSNSFDVIDTPIDRRSSSEFSCTSQINPSKADVKILPSIVE